jgi:hypothetical protein
MGFNNMVSDKKRNSGKRNLRSDSFLEALRDLGGGVAKSAAQDVVGGVAENAFRQMVGKPFGELQPSESLDMKRLSWESALREREKRQFQQEFAHLRRQEKTIWTKAEQETQMQIKVILEELKKLAISTQKLSEEVKIAAEQAPVAPGTYHVSFFEKLRQTIVLFRKRVEESATWLSAFNQKAKKRNYYWAQVKKSGTKFMLSQERYMATQAG